MVGADFSLQAVPHMAPTAARPSQPQPETRAVESSAESTLQGHHAGSTLARMPTAIDQLVESARQFAEVLDTTGNVQVASTVSGFRIGHVDTYA
jgi:hypothetical protein